MRTKGTRHQIPHLFSEPLLSSFLSLEQPSPIFFSGEFLYLTSNITSSERLLPATKLFHDPLTHMSSLLATSHCILISHLFNEDCYIHKRRNYPHLGNKLIMSPRLKTDLELSGCLS